MPHMRGAVVPHDEGLLPIDLLAMKAVNYKEFAQSYPWILLGIALLVSMGLYYVLRMPYRQIKSRIASNVAPPVQVKFSLASFVVTREYSQVVTSAPDVVFSVRGRQSAGSSDPSSEPVQLLDSLSGGRIPVGARFPGPGAPITLPRNESYWMIENPPDTPVGGSPMSATNSDAPEHSSAPLLTSASNPMMLESARNNASSELVFIVEEKNQDGVLTRCLGVGSLKLPSLPFSTSKDTDRALPFSSSNASVEIVSYMPATSQTPAASANVSSEVSRGILGSLTIELSLSIPESPLDNFPVLLSVLRDKSAGLRPLWLITEAATLSVLICNIFFGIRYLFSGCFVVSVFALASSIVTVCVLLQGVVLLSRPLGWVAAAPSRGDRPESSSLGSSLYKKCLKMNSQLKCVLLICLVGIPELVISLTTGSRRSPREAFTYVAAVAVAASLSYGYMFVAYEAGGRWSAMLHNNLLKKPLALSSDPLPPGAQAQSSLTRKATDSMISQIKRGPLPQAGVIQSARGRPSAPSRDFMAAAQTSASLASQAVDPSVMRSTVQPVQEFLLPTGATNQVGTDSPSRLRYSSIRKSMAVSSDPVSAQAAGGPPSNPAASQSVRNLLPLPKKVADKSPTGRV